MGMNRAEVIETMIKTVNDYNINLMKYSKMSEEEITKNVDLQYPALLHMFGLIYDDLEIKGAFK
jgi:hypothetical protein